jgi:hypothetical protein
MKAAFDEIMATAVKRQHEPQRIVGDLLGADYVCFGGGAEVAPNSRHFRVWTRNGHRRSNKKALPLGAVLTITRVLPCHASPSAPGGR